MPCGECSAPVDMALCGAYMMLQACALGLGTCWLGAFDTQAVKDVLKIPPQVRVITMMPLGYHDGTQPRKTRKPLEEIVGHNCY